MFGKLKKLFAGAGTDEPTDRDGVLSLTPADLDAPDRLGPKLAAIAKMQPDVSAAQYDPAAGAVRLGYASGADGTVFLTNLVPTMRALPNGEEVMVYLQNTFADPTIQTPGVLLPVLKPRSYIDIENSPDLAKEDGVLDPLWFEEVAPGLVMTLVRDTPNQMQIVSERGLAAQGLDRESAMAEARASLIDYVNDRGLRISGMEEGALSTVELDGNYEASVYFLDGFWNHVASELGAPPAVIFAARNVVVFASSADAKAMTLLRQVAASDLDPPAYAIDPNRIWRWQDEAWVLDTGEDVPDGPLN